MSYFGERQHRKRYAKYVEKGINDEIHQFYSAKHLATIMGDTTFKEQQLKSLNEQYRRDVHPDYVRVKKYFSMNEIIEIVGQYYSVNTDVILTKKSGCVNNVRMVAIYACRKYTEKTLLEIAYHFNLSTHTAVSNTIVKLRKDKNKDFLNAFEYIEQCQMTT